jgi:very-short-patch-repair endonuclease
MNGDAQGSKIPLPSGGEGGERQATRVRGSMRKPRKVSIQTQRARKMRKEPTLAERLLWSRLRNQRNGIVFRRQQPLGPYIADFYCSMAKLVVELDGWSHDDTREHDEVRTQWLESEKFTVVRLWNMTVIKDSEGAASSLFLFAEELIKQLPHPRFTWHDQEPPHPNPLPRRGEGTASSNSDARDASAEGERQASRGIHS